MFFSVNDSLGRGSCSQKLYAEPIGETLLAIFAQIAPHSHSVGWWKASRDESWKECLRGLDAGAKALLQGSRSQCVAMTVRDESWKACLRGRVAAKQDFNGYRVQEEHGK